VRNVVLGELTGSVVTDFRNDPLKIFAAHELLAVVDYSATTKMTVQFNLFGGTVLKLGTEKHHGDFLRQIDQVHLYTLHAGFLFQVKLTWEGFSFVVRAI
jgi:hypothetical protein